MNRSAAILLISILFAGCGSVIKSGEQQRASEALYFDAVNRGSEPGAVRFMREDPEAYLVAAGASALSDSLTEHQMRQTAEAAARDTLKEAARGWVVDVLNAYSTSFTWSEMRPASELVERLTDQILRASIPVWDRKYYSIGMYQRMLCIHRDQVEIAVVMECLHRESTGRSRDDEIQRLLDRLNMIQTRYALLSNHLQLPRN